MVHVDDQAKTMETVGKGFRSHGRVEDIVTGIFYILDNGGRARVDGNVVDGRKGDATCQPFPCIDPENDPKAWSRVRIVNTN